MHCNTMENLFNKSQSEMNTFEIIATLGMEECQLGRDIRTTFLGDPFCFESTSSSDSLDGTNGEDFDLNGAIRKLREADRQRKLALEKKATSNQHLKGEYGIFGEKPAPPSEPMNLGMEREMLKVRMNALKQESKALEKLTNKSKASPLLQTGIPLTVFCSGVVFECKRPLDQRPQERKSDVFVEMPDDVSSTAESRSRSISEKLMN